MSGLTSRWPFLNWFRSSRDQTDETAQLIDENEDTAPDERMPTRRGSAGTGQEHAIAQLQGAYQEVVGLMHSIEDHMEKQSTRSERLLEMMDGLPEALKSLPEAQRNQCRMLEAIQAHLAEQSKNTATLSEAISGLAQAADNHERSMQIIQKQLDAGQQSNEHLLTSFNSLSGTLDRMTESNQAGTTVLERLADRTDKSDHEMRELFARNQRQMTMMSVISWSLAIVALGVACAVAVWVGQQITSGDAPAASASETPAATESADAAQAGIGGAIGAADAELEAAVAGEPDQIEQMLAAGEGEIGEPLPLVSDDGPALFTAGPLSGGLALPGTLSFDAMLDDESWRNEIAAAEPTEESGDADE